MRKRKSATGRRELLLAIAERYKAANRADRKAILDEFVAVTGYLLLSYSFHP